MIDWLSMASRSVVVNPGCRPASARSVLLVTSETRVAHLVGERAEHQTGGKRRPQRADDPVSIGIADQPADFERVAVEHRLHAGGLEVFQRGAQIDQPGRRPGIGIDGDVAFDLVGAEHALERVHDRRACRFVVHHAGIGDDAVVIGEREMSRYRRYRCGRQDGGSRGCRHDRWLRSAGQQIPEEAEHAEPGEQRDQPPPEMRRIVDHVASRAAQPARPGASWSATGVVCRKPESAAGMPVGMTPPGVIWPISFGRI